MVNADLIEAIEATPDTVISFTTGRKMQVRESVAQIIGRIISYERAIRRGGKHARRKRRIIFAKPSGGES